MKLKYSLILLAVFQLVTQWGFPTSDKTIYCGIAGEPLTFDPAHSLDDTGSIFSYNIFDTLVKVNTKTSRIEPALATSWETKDKGTIWIFKLRKGVSFQDGTDFTADSVVFNFKRQMDETFEYRYYDFPLFQEIFGHLKRVYKIDNYTVGFQLKEPFYPFLASLTSEVAAIVSPAAVKKYGKEFPMHPVGTGPYILKQWLKGKRITLEANPDYWMGSPKVKRVVFIIDQKGDMHLRMFRQQKVDILFSVSISRSVGYKRLKWVTIHRSPKLSSSFITLNFNNKYLKRKSIRKIIYSLWDPRFVTYRFQDFARPSFSILPPGMPGYSDRTKPKSMSIEEAKKLLKKEKLPERISFDLIIESDSDSLDYKMLSLFVQKLEKVGIDIKMQTAIQEKFYKRVTEGKFDMASAGWVADYLDPHSFFNPLFSKRLMEEGFPNFSSYNDETIPAMIRAGAAESNSKKREEIYQKINDIIYDEVLCIPLYYVMSGFVYNNKRIKTLSPNHVGILLLNEIEIK